MRSCPWILVLVCFVTVHFTVALWLFFFVSFFVSFVHFDRLTNFYVGYFIGFNFKQHFLVFFFMVGRISDVNIRKQIFKVKLMYEFRLIFYLFQTKKMNQMLTWNSVLMDTGQIIVLCDCIHFSCVYWYLCEGMTLKFLNTFIRFNIELSPKLNHIIFEGKIHWMFQKDRYNCTIMVFIISNPFFSRFFLYLISVLIFIWLTFYCLQLSLVIHLNSLKTQNIWYDSETYEHCDMKNFPWVSLLI